MGIEKKENANRKHVCVFCTTPYQIIAAISLKEQLKEKTDIYIVNQFKDSKHIAEKLDSLKIFNAVIEVDEKKIYPKIKSESNKYIKHLRMAQAYFTLKRDVSKFLIQDYPYAKIYLSSKAFLGRMAQLYLIKCQKEIETLYFDDGIGSYLGNSLYSIRKSDWLLRRLIIGKKGTEINFTRYLYFPELVNRQLNKDTYKINKLNFVEDSEKIKDLFQREYTKKIKESIVFLQAIDNGILGDEGEMVMQKIIELIFNESKGNMIIKPHPRDKKEKNLKYRYFEKNVPFEVECLFNNMDNKILISICSTASVTPKLLLGQEPKIIFLYKILSQYIKIDNEIEEFLNRFKKIYNDKSKIMIPSNVSELVKIIRRERDE